MVSAREADPGREWAAYTCVKSEALSCMRVVEGVVKGSVEV
jgi:hypothetical protein